MGLHLYQPHQAPLHQQPLLAPLHPLGVALNPPAHLGLQLRGQPPTRLAAAIALQLQMVMGGMMMMMMRSHRYEMHDCVGPHNHGTHTWYTHQMQIHMTGLYSKYMMQVCTLGYILQVHTANT